VEAPVAALSMRDLRNEPGKVERVLTEERVVILNKNHQPLAIMLDVSAQSLETVVKLMSQIRALQAVNEMRAAARARGLDRLTPDEIQTEVDAVRAAR
jgi:hypothetical protein